MSSYLCHWKKVGPVYEMNLVEKPDVKAKGRSFQDGMEKLSDAIRKATNDWEPHMAFWPPQPVAAKRQHLVGDWLLLGTGCDPMAPAEFPKRMFEGGLCPGCNEELGPRTSLPIRFDFAAFQGSDMPYVKDQTYRREIVSEELANALLGGTGGNRELKPCENTGKPSKKNYFEVCPERFVLESPVCLLAPEICRNRTKIFKCKECKRVRPSNSYPIQGISKFVLRSDLEKIAESWFTLLGPLGGYRLIVKAQSVDPLALKQGTKDVIFEWLGLADEKDLFKDAPVQMLPRN